MTGLDAYAVLDGTTWGAFALVLTALGAVVSWQAWKRRGLAAGLRGLAWTLVPLAAWLTGTLKLAASILDDVSTWALHFVFSPAVWLGVVVAGAAVVLFGVSGLLRRRSAGGRRRSARRSGGFETGAARLPQPPGQGTAGLPQPSGQVAEGLPRRRGRKGSAHSSDIEGMDEIEAILKRHGI